MATRTNTTGHVIWFRDDAGKHSVKPRERFEVVGDQHLPMVDDLLAQEPAKPEAAPAEKPEADESA